MPVSDQFNIANVTSGQRPLSCCRKPDMLYLGTVSGKLVENGDRGREEERKKEQKGYRVERDMGNIICFRREWLFS